MKTLRILFTLLAALCLAAFPLVGIFGGMDYIGIPILIGGVFFLLMLLCKNKQLEQEEKQSAAPKADFLNPQPKTQSEKLDNGENQTTPKESDSVAVEQKTDCES